MKSIIKIINEYYFNIVSNILLSTTFASGKSNIL